MSISYDGFSQGSGTGATVTVNHTPGASAKAITAQISHVGSTDRVTGVTYGGVAMTRVRSDADTTGANPDSQGRSYFYELLAGIPSGAQNCVVSRGGTEEVNVVVTSLAANAAIERLAHAGAVATQDLSISLDPGGRTGFGLAAGWTGANSFPIPATGTARYGYISRPSGAEDWSMGALRASAPATSAWVPVWTQTNANNAMSGAIYAEVVTPPPAAVRHRPGRQRGHARQSALARRGRDAAGDPNRHRPARRARLPIPAEQLYELSRADQRGH
jgi:hypothetical protein